MYRFPRVRRLLALSALILGVLAAVAACGKKGSPIRPEKLVPKAVRSLSAFNVSDGVRVSWRAPEKRVNNQPLEDLDHFVILRTSGETKAQCTMPGNPWVRVSAVDADAFPAKPGHIYMYTDRDVRVGKWYSYRVLAVDSGGAFSKNPPYDPVIMRGRPPPRAAAPVTSSGDGFVSLRMPEFPGDVAGWFLYKTTDAVIKPPLFPASDGLVTSREYTDAGLTNGVTYRYAASWVRSQEGFPIEGRRSEWVNAAARDLVPPPAPRSLVGVAREGNVDLRWERVAEPGVGYHVYRRSVSERRFNKLTESLLSENTYIDRPPRGSYVYTVSSVDAVGNESSQGGETTVTVR